MAVDALFHLSFAVDDLDEARRFYGHILGCPEGRRLAGRADFNFFGHHIVAHHAPSEVVGEQGATTGEKGGTPLRHFGAIVTLEEFKRIRARLLEHDVEFVNEPHTQQEGTVREQTRMSFRDGCGNVVEVKGLRSPEDVYAAGDGAGA